MSDAGYSFGMEFETISEEDRRVLNAAMDWQSTQKQKDNECVVLPFRRESEKDDVVDRHLEQSRNDGECVVFPFRSEPLEDEERIVVQEHQEHEDRQSEGKGSRGIIIKGLDGEKVKFNVSEAVFWCR